MDTEIPILYVEDDALSRQVIEILLVRALYFKHVYIFDSSHNFWERLVALPHIPRLILLDIHMYPLDGFDLLGLLRNDARYNHTIIVAVTASVMNDEVEEIQQAGFDGLLAKPIDQASFPDLLKRMLNGEHVWKIQ